VKDETGGLLRVCAKNGKWVVVGRRRLVNGGWVLGGWGENRSERKGWAFQIRGLEGMCFVGGA